MSYVESEYFHVGYATDLKRPKDRFLYRALEILPGFLAWGVLLGTVALSYFAPVAAAFFIIAFDLYWLLKTVFLSIHLRQNWRRTKKLLSTDWFQMASKLKYDHIYHMVMLPFYKEDFEVVDRSLRALKDSRYDHKKIIVVLAAEERAGEEAQKIAREVQEKYKNIFGHFLITTHPGGVEGELAGKGSNLSYAAEVARQEVLDRNNIKYEDTLVSALDIDTVVYPDYFLCLTWHFLTAEKPFRSSFQPIPLYNNNIWEAPAISRVVAGSGTFWQMIQQERPERLATFSSHAVPFSTLYEIKYWQRNIVSEDSRIFWNAFLAFDGDYRVIPISYPVSMDANLASGRWETIKNVYKQQRRWGWGVENLPYIVFGFIKNKNIKLGKRIKVALIQLEGYWSLATNPLIIFLMGWLPLVLGGQEFNQTVLSYNLPFITRNLMTIAMLGLVFSSIIFWSFLPKMPDEEKNTRKRLFMTLQWILIPITITIFSAIPGLESQTRLMVGKYMGFWVTPKERAKK